MISETFDEINLYLSNVHWDEILKCNYVNQFISHYTVLYNVIDLHVRVKYHKLFLDCIVLISGNLL